MPSDGNQLLLSPTALSNHLACRHLTALDRAVTEGRLAAPVRHDPHLDALIARGRAHEEAYVAHLRVPGRSVLDLSEAPVTPDGHRRTVDAIQNGVDAIVQAPLVDGRWRGRADVLLRVADGSYEAVDTKLARDTRAGTILQLCVYTDVLASIAGTLPERMHVVVPGLDFVPESYRAAEFMAYYRLVARHLFEAVPSASPTYPEPVPHCDVCRWWSVCNDRRHADDHLSLVAGISRLQREELAARGLSTLEALGSAAVPFGWRPSRGHPDGYVRMREQARVQLEGRRAGAPRYELLTPEAGQGLARLPSPSEGDVFLDLEGDPFVGDGGLEYLWGWVWLEAGDWEYRHLWALDRPAERGAFGAFVDEMISRWERHPDMHVYHYAPYEPAALKRLMGRYATHEAEIDRMLRAGLFVDLYAVVRQGVRASVERYSIKDMEVFFGYERATDLREASRALGQVEAALELGHLDAGPSGNGDGLDPQLLEEVRSYNRDDCAAARHLRDWLERLRLEAGEPIPRPEARSGEASKKIGEWEAQIRPVWERLAAGVPPDPDARTDGETARWRLAHMLDFFRREDNVGWWNYFRLLDLSEEEMLDDPEALSGLEFVERVGMAKTRPVDRYRFPSQETKIRDGDKLKLTSGDAFGSVGAMDLRGRTLDILKHKKQADVHPTAVFLGDVIPGQLKGPELLRIAEWVAANGIDAPGPYRAARDLLLGRAPRFRPGTLWPFPEAVDPQAAAVDLVTQLDESALAIQGPPGSGKTWTAAEMAVRVLSRGGRVGVTALSHKVIRHLLAWIVERAEAHGVEVRCLHKVGERPLEELPNVADTKANDDVETAVRLGTFNVIAGTSWLWARGPMREAVDVLFIDEAGQLSLADAVVSAQGARSVVLVGDPSQLDQPLQGSHPEGTGVSALGHLLDGAQTMPVELGLFLSRTRRLAPAICEFVSEMFYAGRLGTIEGLERQALTGPGPVRGSGLFYAPVEHPGNRTSSVEEIERIRSLWDELTRGDTFWTNSAGVRQAVGENDILVVAPYNAQVSDLKQVLPPERVGTVDKFQGQEAAVVIISMTTSSADEAPRGMEFLYSLNRLNVATSRARCAAILVASPTLFEPECRTPAQMRLANAFCRYLEMARVI